MVQISGVSNKDELNPFEIFTRLKSAKPHQEAFFFNRFFDSFLRNYYGFVIESESKLYRNYIHFSGIAIIRVHRCVSKNNTLIFIKGYD
jgi:hypothetical protein